MQAGGGLADAHHRRDAIFARHHRAVRHHPAHFHHQPAGRQEQGRPGRVGGRADQDFPWGQLHAVRVQHHPHHALAHPRRNGAAGNLPGKLPVDRRWGSLVEGAAIAEHHARHALAAQLAPVDLPARGDHFLPRRPGTAGQVFELVQVQVEHIVRLLQQPLRHHLLPGLQQGQAHQAQDAHDHKLGRLAQPTQLAHPAPQQARQARLEPTARLPGQGRRQALQGGFAPAGPALEDRLGRGLRIIDLQVAFEHLDDVQRVLLPARPAQVDLAHAAQAIHVQEGGQRHLGRRGQPPGQVGGGQLAGRFGAEGLPGGRVTPDGLGGVPQGQVHLRGDIVRQAARQFQRQVGAAGHLWRQPVQQDLQRGLPGDHPRQQVRHQDGRYLQGHLFAGRRQGRQAAGSRLGAVTAGHLQGHLDFALQAPPPGCRPEQVEERIADHGRQGTRRAQPGGQVGGLRVGRQARVVHQPAHDLGAGGVHGLDKQAQALAQAGVAKQAGDVDKQALAGHQEQALRLPVHRVAKAASKPGHQVRKGILANRGVRIEHALPDPKEEKHFQRLRLHPFGQREQRGDRA